MYIGQTCTALQSKLVTSSLENSKVDKKGCDTQCGAKENWIWNSEVLLLHSGPLCKYTFKNTRNFTIVEITEFHQTEIDGRDIRGTERYLEMGTNRY